MKLKIIFPVLAIVVAVATLIGMSSFDKAPKTTNAKPPAGYFYRYQLTDYDTAKITNIANYQRSNLSCAPGDHVCGVYLSTNTGLGNQPVPSEFNAVKSALANSEIDGAPVDESVAMRQ